MYPNFQFVMDQIVASLQELLSNTDVSFLEKDSGTSSMITGAFSMALCCKLIWNKIKEKERKGHLSKKYLMLIYKCIIRYPSSYKE